MLPKRKNVLRLDDSKAKLQKAQVEPKPAPDEWVFALDIGTRSVIGIVGVERGENIEVLAAHMLEHTQRSMIDGQIHDIASVAAATRSVKLALEKTLGRKLQRVSVAAAGRVLKTSQVHVEREIDEGVEIDAELVGSLEMEAIRLAQDKVAEDMKVNGHNPFYCVGYSVIQYQLDDMPITHIVGHKGYRAGLSLLATFLPHMVVDSIFTVMERNDLQVSSMTLEPIAALNVAIPRDLRMLNLALVDIGAGTSDIAITKGGTVVGYGMAAIAGDEISECIAQEYLVDFQTAEKIKLAVSKGQKTVLFRDIMDNEVEASAEDVQKVVRPVVEQLARSIADRILEGNGGKSPNAIFLVGGGSQTSELATLLAHVMGLPPERVAVRNRSIAKSIIYAGEILQGPECITPFGILTTAFLHAGKDFYHVFVDEQRVKLYNTRRMTLSDALLLAGYTPDQLIGRSGKALSIYVNGAQKSIRGGFGRPAEITLNGKHAGLTSTIAPGDRIGVVKAERGKDAASTVGEQSKVEAPAFALINNVRICVKPKFSVNGKLVSEAYNLSENDQLVTDDFPSIEEIAQIHGLDLKRHEVRNMDNNETLSNKYKLEPGVEIVFSELSLNIATGAEATDSQGITHEEEINASQQLEDNNLIAGFLDREKPISTKIAQELSDGFYITVNGEPALIPGHGKNHMFVDVFNHVKFDFNNAKGNVFLRLNGMEAGYTDLIGPGDIIEISWSE